MISESNKKKPYECYRCGYKISRKYCMTRHLYGNKITCQALLHNIELTDTIKDTIINRRTYNPKDDVTITNHRPANHQSSMCCRERPTVAKARHPSTMASINQNSKAMSTPSTMALIDQNSKATPIPSIMASIDQNNKATPTPSSISELLHEDLTTNNSISPMVHQTDELGSMRAQIRKMQIQIDKLIEINLTLANAPSTDVICEENITNYANDTINEPIFNFQHTRKVTNLTKKVIAARQKWLCGHCGEMLDETYEVDHIVALYQGGTNDLDNLMALDPHCHRLKTFHQQYL